jgi:chromosome segregation ATPase
MLITSSRNYNETYYKSRKQLLKDFLIDEESEAIKSITQAESLVSSTKLLLNGIVTGSMSPSDIYGNLKQIETELSLDCSELQQTLNTLNHKSQLIQQEASNQLIQEEKEYTNFVSRIEKLKNELEIKEFTIQNMEKIYIELEHIIKQNVSQGKAQPLTVEEFDMFITTQNIIINECDKLEKERNSLLNEYNCLLRENVNLKSLNESFEIEQMKNALEEIATMGNVQKEAEKRLHVLQKKYNELYNECNELTNKMLNVIKTLDGLNIDNLKLNKSITVIKRDIFYYEERLNHSFSHDIDINNDWIDIDEQYINTHLHRLRKQ